MDRKVLFPLCVVALAGAAALFRLAQPPRTVLAPVALSTFPARNAFESRAFPTASARVQQLVVYVAGKVVRPGVYRLPVGERAEGAVRMAGGAMADADLVAVNLAELVTDGEEIVVPERGAETCASTRARGGHHSRSHRAFKGRPRSVDLNTADVEQLQTLPGVGPSLASRIIAFRQLNGLFQNVDDLRDVGGMTDGKVERIVPYVNVNR